MNELLRITDLHTFFDTPEGVVRANYGVNLAVNEREVVGVMGESGCGKTVLFLSILRLQQPGEIVKGSIQFDGCDLLGLSEKEMRKMRGRGIGLIPQDHATSLNPVYTVREQLREVLAIGRSGGGLAASVWGGFRLDRNRADSRIDAVLRSLSLHDAVRSGELLGRYPHQLSGGIRQRVLIAMALLARPKLLIADEPTTALDHYTRMEIVGILKGLQRRLTMLIVSHDLDLLSQICDRVAVMYGGRIVEQGASAEIFSRPRHPYTQLLISCERLVRGAPLSTVSGEVLNLIDFPPGCSFHPRCPVALPRCAETAPPDVSVGGAVVSCHHYPEGGQRCSG